MNITPIAAAALLAFSAAAAAEAPPRSVDVTGTGEVSAAPDLAYITVSVQARETELATARQRVNDTAARFLALMKKLRIPADKVQTTGSTINPEFRWDKPRETQVLTGYFAQRQLTVELDRLEILGEVIEGAVDAGVNQVSPPVLDSSRRRELYREALAAAAEDARRNAEVLASTLGARLGAVRTISTLGDYRPPIPLDGRAEMRAMAMDAAPAQTYQAGDIRFEARVSASFALAGD